ncbi:MAG: hypothetical protein AB4368_31370 [Xenococcaceae cyanobacterium]
MDISYYICIYAKSKQEKIIMCLLSVHSNQWVLVGATSLTQGDRASV